MFNLKKLSIDEKRKFSLLFKRELKNTGIENYCELKDKRYNAKPWLFPWRWIDYTVESDTVKSLVSLYTALNRISIIATINNFRRKRYKSLVRKKEESKKLPSSRNRDRENSNINCASDEK